MPNSPPVKMVSRKLVYNFWDRGSEGYNPHVESRPKPDTPELYHRITDILKCKWTLAILDGIRRGVNRPGRLERELPGLTTKVLNDRIRKLERYGVIHRITYPEIPPHVEYIFTPRGEELLEMLRRLREFVEEWETESSAPPEPSHR